MASVCFADLGLGVTAGTDVSKSDLLGVLILVRCRFLAGCVAGIKSDTDVVFLHVRGGDSVNALAGWLLLGIAAPTTVAGSTTTAVAFAGGVRSVVDEVGMRLLLLNKVATYAFQAFFELRPRVGPFELAHLPGPNEGIAELKYILVGEVETHGDHELLEGQLVGEFGVKLVVGSVKHCDRKPAIHQLMECECGVFGSHVAGGGRL